MATGLQSRNGRGGDMAKSAVNGRPVAKVPAAEHWEPGSRYGDAWEPPAGRVGNEFAGTHGRPCPKARNADAELRGQDESPPLPPDDPTDDEATAAAIVDIHIGPDEHRVNDEAVAALAADPDLFSRGGQLVRVLCEQEEDDTALQIRFPIGPRIKPVSAATLRERLTAVARFWKPRDSKSPSPASPSKYTVQAILDRGEWPGVQQLVSVVDFPVMLPDGNILSAPGYHRASGLIYLPRSPLSLSVPDRPTPADARRAVAELLDVVCEFPFAADHYRAGWLAGLLTPLARYAFTGCTPMFLVEGNVPGCGKGLLVDALACIVRGANLAVATFPSDGNEFRKRVTAILVRGPSMVLLDNLAGRLGCPELDALLTSPLWSDRILGESKDIAVPNLTAWYATGNNVAVQGDTLRRVCPVRLESPLERPEERSDIRRRDLRGWVIQERPRLLSAALTILRAYHVAGRPDMKLPQWGSFESWSDSVRGAITWAGQPDPWQGRQALRDEHGDDAIAAMGGLLRMWKDIDPDGTGLTTANIVRRIDGLPPNHPLSEVLLQLAGGRPDSGKPDKRAQTLGYRVRAFNGRVVSEHRLVRAGESAGVKRWRAEPVC